MFDFDKLVEEHFTQKDQFSFDSLTSLIEELLEVNLNSSAPPPLLVERVEPGVELAYSSIPDIPISEIPWSTIATAEGGAEIPSEQREQLMQFLRNIEGEDLQDKLASLASFYNSDPATLLEGGFFGDSSASIIAKALSYLTFYKTLTKIVTHFNASSAGFSFESFLGVLLGGVQVPTGQSTIADMVTGDGIPISLKLYNERTLKVGGSFTDLVNDLVQQGGTMQYIAVTKTLEGEGDALNGDLEFYRFNFTLDNIANVLIRAGRENPELMMLPHKFIDNPDEFDIEMPSQLTPDQIAEAFLERFKVLLGDDALAQEVYDSVNGFNVPQIYTGQVKSKKRLGMGRISVGQGGRSYRPSYNAGLMILLRELSAGNEQISENKEEIFEAAYTANQELAKRIYEINAERREILGAAGGAFADEYQSREAYNKMNERLKRRALLLSRGYVHTLQFELSRTEVYRIANVGTSDAPVLPEGQENVAIGTISIGRTNIEEMLKSITSIIDQSVFEIFTNLKILTSSIQAFFAGALQDNNKADEAIGAAENIESKTEELKSVNEEAQKKNLIDEEVYYRGDSGELEGPVSSVEKIAQDIIKYIKRLYPHEYQGSDLKLKGGKKVLKFTNFGSLKTRDAIIRDLEERGYLSGGEVKRSQLYHRAQTRFVDVLANGKEQPIIIQLDAGGGGATSGGDYETEMQNLLNNTFAREGKTQYVAEKQGGSTNNPDLVVFKDEQPYWKFEAKTVMGSDFGQFQLQHDGVAFSQKTQASSGQLSQIFDLILDDLNQNCSLRYNPQRSGDLLRISVPDLGSRVEAYYQEKGVDFIIVKDMIYSSSDRAQKVLPLAQRFKDAVSNDEGEQYVRVRVKCHGKSYSTTAANKFRSIQPSIEYYDPRVLETLFPN